MLCGIIIIIFSLCTHQSSDTMLVKTYNTRLIIRHKMHFHTKFTHIFMVFDYGGFVINTIYNANVYYVILVK